MNWATDTFKLALITSAYVPSLAHTVWADVSTNEVADGLGYTIGGLTLTNNLITDAGMFTDDLIWTNLTKTFRYGVIYKVGLANALQDPLFAYILWNDANLDRVINGIDFGVYQHADGIIKFI